MTSNHGFYDGSCDFRQMYNVQDLRGALPEPVILPGTILSELSSNEDYATFFSLIAQTGIAKKLNSQQGYFTLFAPVNESFPDWIMELDNVSKQNVINMHLFENNIPPEILSQTRAMFLYPLLKSERVLVENVQGNGPLLNHSVVVVGYKRVGNGIIYMTNGALMPTTLPNTNVPL